MSEPKTDAPKGTRENPITEDDLPFTFTEPGWYYLGVKVEEPWPRIVETGHTLLPIHRE